MTPEKWEKVTELFHSAMDLDAEDRSAFIERECAGDPELRQEVESLLAANTDAGNFIEEPAAQVAALADTGMTIPAGSMIAHYRIEKSIGRGGMGEVYLALDTRLNRQVALKKLPDLYSSDPAFLRRFRNEAQAAATLNHPNVATIYSVETFEEKPFITMEYVDGKTLDAATPASGLDIRKFLEYFIQLAGALQHAHEKGITHRDLKPGNIMITSGGVPKILDFGLAQSSGAALSKSGFSAGITAPGQVIGTPSYMSPEQAEGKDVDHRSDIFSFGVVMYEALTGLRPFTGDSHAEVVSNLLKSDPVPIREIRPEVPSLIVRLVNRCLIKRRRDRLQQMQEVRTILAEARAVLKAGTSTLSLGRRLYGEAKSVNPLWRFALVFAIILASFVAWYFFPRDVQPPIYFENISIRSLSQSHNVVFAQISPDGRSLAYNTIEPNQDRSLWIRRIDDRNALLLVPPQPHQYWGGLTISDDTSQIFFITAGATSRHGTMYRVSSLGGPVRKLVDTVNDLGSLSPDGKRILYVRYGEPTSILTANSDDGGDERPILSFPEGVILRDPQFSPDGSYVYFIKMERKDGVEYWSLNHVDIRSGAQAVVIPDQRERIAEIAFVGRSNALIMNAADPITNATQLFYVSLPDGKLTRVTNDLNSYFGVSVDRAGTQIVSAQRYFEKRLWTGDAGGTVEMKAIAPEINAYLNVDWTPDGRLVFDAVENNRPHIWIAAADGSGLMQLTPNDSTDEDPAVSKDGRYIVFTSSRNGHKQVWRMNIDGRNQMWLAQVEGVTSNPHISPDGVHVIFVWDREGSRSLGRVPIEGGNIEEMPLFGDSHWSIAADGSRVAYTIWNDQQNISQVAIRRFDSDRPDTVLDLSPYAILKWKPDGSGLVYRDRRAVEFAHSTIMEWNFEAASPTQIFSAEPDTIQDFSFSPDGKKAAAIVGKLITDAVLLSKRPER